MAGRDGLLTRARLWAIRRFRRSRFLPIGMPDKIADDQVLGRPLDAEIIVYFPTGQDTLYQLRPWYPALRALHARHRVAVVFRDSRTARVVAAESSLPCLTLARYGQLDEILGLSMRAGADVKLALYVNHDPINFECLRFTSLVHVYLGHGDSDKGVSASNQVKAYDLCFLAGQAALDRTAAATMLYDAPARSVLIGQPQLDGERPTPRPSPDGRPTVLYAPTWEASQPSVAYGSVERVGERIVSSLTSAYRVVYRPHPLNGVIRPEYAAADRRVRDLADRVDADVPLERSFADADLLITDVSAVPLNWLPTGRPVLITSPEVPFPPSRLMQELPTLADDADVAAEVSRHLIDDPVAEQRTALIEYYLGDPTPGVATERFVQACSETIAMRDRAWSEAQARGATGP